MNRTAIAVPVLAVAVAFLLGGRGTHPAVAADAPAATNGVVVEGLGKVSGTPDVLRVTMGVSVRRPDVSAAVNAANAAENRLRSALMKNGVAKADLQTAEVSIYPSYDNRGRRNGYAVNETVIAKLRNLSKAGSVMSKAISAAGNEAVLQGVSFSLEDNKELLQQARDAAYADARDKAEQYAKLSGRALGKVELVTESTSAPVELRHAYDSTSAALAKQASPVPIDPGSQQVSVSVTVRWALT
ncbi:MAG: SIMPL domain-containing protein [Mycobacteriales bacterium]